MFVFIIIFSIEAFKLIFYWVSINLIYSFFVGFLIVMIE